LTNDAEYDICQNFRGFLFLLVIVGLIICGLSL